ncbi:MAG TPA: D-alanyl-D-alanine carboxypeptidase/D-alanyl-D-alanine-endopeptidase [Pyrinomonadaceae bacterium]|jgi:D-alanyl-D-alanine carboxypeptidase/D-alanyl-D-alanine-endopeptidase (penicillin-binding protein 4)
MPLKNSHPSTRRPSPPVSTLLLVALLLSAAPARATRAAQESQRERRVGTPAPAARPTPTPAPAQATPARPTPAQSPTPAASQTPTPTPTPQPTSAAPQTLEELRARIRDVLARPEFAASRVAVKVASLDTGRVLFEQDARKWMQPASNMKLFTVAAALDRLTPEYRFVTSVYAPARPDAAGTVRGDLVVYGRGDPSFATRFNPEGNADYFLALDALAADVHAAGVRRVEGDLVGDESYFTGAPMPTGWEWDDLQWYYGAEVSALTVNDNSVDLSVKPGASVGSPARITLGPSTPLVTIIDRTTTSARGTTRELSVNRALGQNTIEIRGRVPIDDRGYAASLAVSRPALLFASMLRAALERRGVVFTGQTRTVDAQGRAEKPLPVSSLVEIAARKSPPLSVIAAQVLKPSQNLYAELLLRTLGKLSGSTDPKLSSEDAGAEAVRKFLTQAGIDPSGLVMLDGSGLSRADLLTADTTLQLLVYMNRHRFGSDFRAALPVAGLDGTLRNRMRGTPAQGNVRAKTGTLGTATSLSGYVFSAAGERLAFSLMINNPPRDANPRTDFTDVIAVLLASFAGRS